MNKITIKANMLVIAQLRDVYKEFDGYKKIVTRKNPEGVDMEDVVIERYKFKNGAVYHALGKNLSTLTKVIQDLDKARSEIVKSLAPEGVEELTAKDHPNEWQEFIESYQNLVNMDQDVTLLVIKLDDLELGDKNPIPGSILSVLFTYDLIQTE